LHHYDIATTLNAPQSERNMTTHDRHAPLAVVTCGPGVSPIDSVRRISNFSTGELGVRLSEMLLEHGWQVACFKSIAATYPFFAAPGLWLECFDTNADLMEKLRLMPHLDTARVVFHTAALSDFEVSEVLSLEGEPLESLKFSSRLPGLTLKLTPAPKVLPQLRHIFPTARIVGWKFELEGDTSSALERGARQLRENGSALCVVNGAAFGEGFGVLDPQGALTRLRTRSELCAWLARWADKLVPVHTGMSDCERSPGTLGIPH